MEEVGFHRKYRPISLKGYIGNSKLKESLKKSLDNSVRPQVFLISGPAGTGKTTIARLIAKEYICEHRDAELGACNICMNCASMNEFILTGQPSFSLTNIREVDVTDSNKKQDIDDLLEEASMPSFDGNWKIYILDECHMMTNSAQNRLLKTLEEPPEKVLMILCTTNPEKLLETIVSRCQFRHSVKKPTKEELTGLLRFVCKEESILYESRALNLICAKSDFVPRKALIELENISREAKDVKYTSAVKILNVVADTYYFEFFDIILQDYVDIQRYIQFIGRLKVDIGLHAFMDSVIPFLLRGIYVVNAVSVESLDISEVKQYKEVFKRFRVDEVAGLLSKLLEIKESRDKEAKLMLLGYMGIHIKKEETYNYEVIDNTVVSTAEEKKAGDDLLNKSKEVTPEEEQEMLKILSMETTLEHLAAEFGGQIVKNSEKLPELL